MKRVAAAPMTKAANQTMSTILPRKHVALPVEHDLVLQVRGPKAPHPEPLDVQGQERAGQLQGGMYPEHVESSIVRRGFPA